MRPALMIKSKCESRDRTIDMKAGIAAGDRIGNGCAQVLLDVMGC
jgi:hypothetical protein